MSELVWKKYKHKGNGKIFDLALINSCLVDCEHIYLSKDFNYYSKYQMCVVFEELIERDWTTPEIEVMNLEDYESLVKFFRLKHDKFNQFFIGIEMELVCWIMSNKSKVTFSGLNSYYNLCYELKSKNWMYTYSKILKKLNDFAVQLENKEK